MKDAVDGLSAENVLQIGQQSLVNAYTIKYPKIGFDVP
jgi:hypothetical protein